MTTLTVTEIYQKTVEADVMVRADLERFVTPRVTEFRALVSRMKTSTLLGYSGDAATLMRWFEGEVNVAIGVDKDIVGAESLLAMYAITDELDCRMPVPTNIMDVNATLIAELAEKIKHTDPDETIRDCERRIDRLCDVVSSLALLVRAS